MFSFIYIRIETYHKKRKKIKFLKYNYDGFIEKNMIYIKKLITICNMCAKGPEIREGKKFLVKLRKKLLYLSSGRGLRSVFNKLETYYRISHTNAIISL